MLVTYAGQQYALQSGTWFHDAVLGIVKLAEQETAAGSPLAERNDVKQVFRDYLRPAHRKFLRAVARRPGISQTQLEVKLGLTTNELRGVHNGLTRITNTQGIERLVRTMGYRNENRRYTMDLDVARTINKIPKKK
jgi:hypothetical protein